MLHPYLYDYSIDIVWEFQRKTNGEPDSIKHLRGACDRLLVENPDNPSLLLLRSFARLLIPGFDKTEAISDYINGWRLYLDKEGWSRSKYMDNVSTFYKNTIEYDPSVREYLDIEILKEHTNWVSSFSKAFIEGIEYA